MFRTTYICCRLLSLRSREPNEPSDLVYLSNRHSQLHIILGLLNTTAYIMLIKSAPSESMKGCERFPLNIQDLKPTLLLENDNYCI